MMNLRNIRRWRRRIRSEDLMTKVLDVVFSAAVCDVKAPLSFYNDFNKRRTPNAFFVFISLKVKERLA